MGTSNSFQAVHVVKLSGNLVAKEPAGAARAHSPRIDVFRVAPYKVTKRSLVRDLLGTCNNPDLIDSPNLRAQAPVDTKDGTVDDGGQD